MTEEVATTEHRAPSTEPQLSPLISIIIPAYNCEKYIPQCLDSLVNQDIPERNYEVFITDDGSTDSTGTICDEYAEKYPFIHVTHTDNHGPSHARNVGLSQCRSEYIIFCDSDDFVSPQYISVLTRTLELHNDTDMLVFKYMYDLPDGKWPLYDLSSMKDSDWQPLTAEDLIMRVFGDISIGGYSWNKLIKRVTAQSNPFNNELSVNEDHWWIVNILNKHRDIHIYFADYCLYCYMQRPDTGQGKLPERIYSKDGMSLYVAALEKELEFENLSPDTVLQIKALIYYWSTNNMYRMGRLMTEDVRKKIKSYLKDYAGTYYFRSVHPLSWKLRALVRHIAIFLHIFKYR